MVKDLQRIIGPSTRRMFGVLKSPKIATIAQSFYKTKNNGRLESYFFSFFSFLFQFFDIKSFPKKLAKFSQISTREK